MIMKDIKLSQDTRKLIKSKKIDFIIFLKWFKSNKDKINKEKEKYLITTEKNFKRYFNNPNEYIYVLIFLFKKNH